MLNTDDRSAVYEIFASVYTKLPTEETLKDFMTFSQEFTKIIATEDSKQVAKMAAERYLAAVSDNGENLRKIQQEYYDHFFVPSSGKYVPPFESAVTEGRLWGNAAEHCAACYDTLDFEPRNLGIFSPLKEIGVPDYIGFQLAFMAYLVKGELDAGTENEAWQNLQSQFVTQHLEKWLPAYTAALAQTGSSFYTALAATILEFVVQDATLLKDCKGMRGELN